MIGAGVRAEYQRSDLRDTRDPREHSDLRDPRNSEMRDLAKYRSSLEKKDPRDSNWDLEESRRDPRDVNPREFREVSTIRGLRETRIYGDERDFRDERSAKELRELRNLRSARDFRDYRGSNRDFTDNDLGTNKFDPRDRLEYFDRDRRDPYDPRSIDRRVDRYNIPLRKNDSMSDLRDERRHFSRHDGSVYRSEHNRFPHHHSMRESRRDVQDRLESERRNGYSSGGRRLEYSSSTKGDQSYLRQYNDDDIPPYRGSSSGGGGDGDYHISRETSSGAYTTHEKLRRTEPSLMDSTYHHSLPRRDHLRAAYSDKYSDYPAPTNKMYPHSPEGNSPPSPAPGSGGPRHYNDGTRPGGRRGRYSEMDGKFEYNDNSASQMNVSESVVPRLKVRLNDVLLMTLRRVNDEMRLNNVIIMCY